MSAPLPFSSVAFALPFWTVYVLAFGTEFLRQVREDSPDEGTVRDAGSKHVIYAFVGGGTAIAFFVALAVPAAAITTVPVAVFAVGLGVTLGGTALRLYAVRTLGDSFNSTVNVRADQAVVEAGPYRWVRHPSYTGAVLMFLGVGLALTNWASVACALLGALGGYGYRVRVEERALRAELGSAYEAYAERTPYRIVPFVY